MDDDLYEEIENELEQSDDDLDDTPDDEVEGSIDDDDDSSERYTFEFSDDGLRVIAAFEYDDGVLERESINKHDSYTVQDDLVIHSRTKPFGSEVTTYADADGDGYYERIAEQWIGSSTPPTNNPVPALAHVLRYLSTDDDDWMAVREGDTCSGGLGADQFVIKEAAHLRIGDFKRGEGDKVVFDTGLGLTSKEELQSYVTALTQDGDNLIVEFGTAATITLIGVTAEDIGWDDVLVLS